VLITGGAGFVGTNLADRLALEGRRVILYDDLSRAGVENNLRWLTDRHGAAIQVMIADVRNYPQLRRAVAQARSVFHLAAQVAVTTSLVDPRSDFEINVGGTLNLLEAMRATGTAESLVFTSTNKVYGLLGDAPLIEQGDALCRGRAGGARVAETQCLDFHSPYGCSKGAADQYVLDYARSYGLPASVFRMSCIYGPHQHGTEDQGWVAHFALRAAAGMPISIYGDGKQSARCPVRRGSDRGLPGCRAPHDVDRGPALQYRRRSRNATRLREPSAQSADAASTSVRAARCSRRNFVASET